MLLTSSFTFAVLLCLRSCTATPYLGTRQTDNTEYHWVDAWTSMPQLVEPDNLPPAPFRTNTAILTNTTLRQTLHLTLTSGLIRIQISNLFGRTPLPLTTSSLALPKSGKAGAKDILSSPIAGLTFNGSSSVTIPAGRTVYSDPVDFAVKAQSELTMTLYLAKGQEGSSVTGHPGSRTTSWMGVGEGVNATGVGGGSTKHW
ncbi:hypothetical protein ONS95_006380 [Cadophora gregata]|uniref:uncharacterized protein n=1 Tax=Cadophora gregata TaxID=51156 RepID=UPI0026DBD103|nr:uncharacterized protein ONS95_006380 [Cadophora gregata]KAK0102783.1 hypothetical protein ONS95_006380 [Cadophora gregata]